MAGCWLGTFARMALRVQAAVAPSLYEGTSFTLSIPCQPLNS